MTKPGAPRRAIALLHSNHDPQAYEALVRKHNLNIVHTVHTDTAPVLAALIAVQHALDHAADAVAIPHLTVLEPRTPWWAVTHAADLITAIREYPLWSALIAPKAPHQ